TSRSPKSLVALPSSTCSPPSPFFTTAPAIKRKSSPRASPPREPPSPSSTAASSLGKPKASPSSAPTDPARRARFEEQKPPGPPGPPGFWGGFRFDGASRVVLASRKPWVSFVLNTSHPSQSAGENDTPRCGTA